ncbi:IS3 family transposase [Mammaliicoccus sciuri]|uniref:IS3 family transposase n=1 Tax=Mammaliicoccus sciuri TaxID=1296 RepID=UPI002159E2D6|nr:IS3 family transposase [Mammaliicoccus sciuri]
MKALHEIYNIRLSILFKVAQIAKSVYYYWINQLSKADKDETLIQVIKEICEESNHTYGYRRVTQALRNRGLIVNHKKVLRIMKEYNLTCTKFTHRGRKYRSFKGKVGKVAQNILNRRFKTSLPFQKVVTDITEFKLMNGQKLYLSPFMDLYSSEIISFKISSRPTLDIVINPLKEMIERRPNLDHRLTIHSDQGWHYQHSQYTRLLKDHKIFQSMSRKGNCLDNSVMENFFGLLKQEMYYGQEFKDFQDLEQAIHQYINFYNNERIKSKLKGLSPKNYRRQTFEIIY